VNVAARSFPAGGLPAGGNAGLEAAENWTVQGMATRCGSPGATSASPTGSAGVITMPPRPANGPDSVSRPAARLAATCVSEKPFTTSQNASGNAGKPVVASSAPNELLSTVK
jgi:hypothetical protein